MGRLGTVSTTLGHEANIANLSKWNGGACPCCQWLQARVGSRRAVCRDREMSQGQGVALVPEAWMLTGDVVSGRAGFI